MKAYVDSSVVMRRVLGQREQLKEWDRIDLFVGSILLFIECSRIVNRARIAPSGLPESAIDPYRETLSDVFENIEFVDIDESVVVRACQPLPFAIGTLDAIHLATAI